MWRGLNIMLYTVILTLIWLDKVVSDQTSYESNSMCSAGHFYPVSRHMVFTSYQTFTLNIEFLEYLKTLTQEGNGLPLTQESLSLIKEITNLVHAIETIQKGFKDGHGDCKITNLHLFFEDLLGFLRVANVDPKILTNRQKRQTTIGDDILDILNLQDIARSAELIEKLKTLHSNPQENSEELKKILTNLDEDNPSQYNDMDPQTLLTSLTDKLLSKYGYLVPNWTPPNNDEEQMITRSMSKQKNKEGVENNNMPDPPVLSLDKKRKFAGDDQTQSAKKAKGSKSNTNKNGQSGDTQQVETSSKTNQMDNQQVETSSESNEMEDQQVETSSNTKKMGGQQVETSSDSSTALTKQGIDSEKSKVPSNTRDRLQSTLNDLDEEVDMDLGNSVIETPSDNQGENNLDVTRTQQIEFYFLESFKYTTLIQLNRETLQPPMRLFSMNQIIVNLFKSKILSESETAFLLDTLFKVLRIEHAFLNNLHKQQDVRYFIDHASSCYKNVDKFFLAVNPRTKVITIAQKEQELIYNFTAVTFGSKDVGFMRLMSKSFYSMDIIPKKSCSNFIEYTRQVICFNFRDGFPTCSHYYRKADSTDNKKYWDCKFSVFLDDPNIVKLIDNFIFSCADGHCKLYNVDQTTQKKKQVCKFFLSNAELKEYFGTTFHFFNGIKIISDNPTYKRIVIAILSSVSFITVILSSYILFCSRERIQAQTRARRVTRNRRINLATANRRRQNIRETYQLVRILS